MRAARMWRQVKAMRLQSVERCCIQFLRRSDPTCRDVARSIAAIRLSIFDHTEIRQDAAPRITMQRTVWAAVEAPSPDLRTLARAHCATSSSNPSSCTSARGTRETQISTSDTTHVEPRHRRDLPVTRCASRISPRHPPHPRATGWSAHGRARRRSTAGSDARGLRSGSPGAPVPGRYAHCPARIAP